MKKAKAEKTAKAPNMGIFRNAAVRTIEILKQAINPSTIENVGSYFQIEP